MAAIVTTLAVLILALSLAVTFVGRLALRMERQPPPPLYSMDAVFKRVFHELPDDVAATLTPKDARKILRLGAAYLESKLAQNEVIDPALAADYVLHEASSAGLALIREQVGPVIRIQWDHLVQIGAVSTPAEL